MNRVTGRLSMAVAGLAIVVLTAQLAEAQGRQGRRGFGRRGQDTVSLAGMEQVQGLLKFTEEQVTKIAEISDKLDEDRAALREDAGFGGFGRGGGGGGFDADAFAEYQEKQAKLVADAEAKVAEVLDDTQDQQILGVLIQLRGGPSLADAQLSKQLKLTQEQNTKIADLAPGFGRGGGRGQGGFRRGGGGRGGMTPEQIAERDKEYLDILTTDQQGAYAKLKESVTLSEELMQQLQGGRRGRGGGGRGRGRGGAGGGAGGGGAGDGGGF